MNLKTAAATSLLLLCFACPPPPDPGTGGGAGGSSGGGTATGGGGGAAGGAGGAAGGGAAGGGAAGGGAATGGGSGGGAVGGGGGGGGGGPVDCVAFCAPLAGTACEPSCDCRDTAALATNTNCATQLAAMLSCGVRPGNVVCQAGVFSVLNCASEVAALSACMQAGVTCVNACARAAAQVSCTSDCLTVCNAGQVEAANVGCLPESTSANRCLLTTASPFTCSGTTLNPPSGCIADFAAASTCVSNARDAGAGGGGGATGGGGGATGGGGGGATQDAGVWDGGASGLSACSTWERPVTLGFISDTAIAQNRVAVRMASLANGDAVFALWNGFDVQWFVLSNAGLAVDVDQDAGLVTSLSLAAGGNSALGGYYSRPSPAALAETRTRRFTAAGWQPPELLPPGLEPSHLQATISASGDAMLWRVGTNVGSGDTTPKLAEYQATGSGPLVFTRELSDAGPSIEFVDQQLIVFRDDTGLSANGQLALPANWTGVMGRMPGGGVLAYSVDGGQWVEASLVGSSLEPPTRLSSVGPAGTRRAIGVQLAGGLGRVYWEEEEQDGGVYAFSSTLGPSATWDPAALVASDSARFVRRSDRVGFLAPYAVQPMVIEVTADGYNGPATPAPSFGNGASFSGSEGGAAAIFTQPADGGLFAVATRCINPRVRQISAGGGSIGEFTCARLVDGTARCAGYNSNAELGDGTTTIQPTPVAVSGVATLSAITSGGNHSCGLLANGTVQCWGKNDSGQLGGGSTGARSPPVPVAGLTDATQVSAGDRHTCALKAGGTVVCWGNNFSGQLGNNSTTDATTPVVVQGLTGVAQVSAGSNHSCAVMLDGTARCWGNNFNGQLGNGLLSDSLTPVPVSLTNIAAIASGFFYTCARLGDGTVRCWGSNAFGQLGDGTSMSSSLPVVVSGLTGAAALSLPVYGGNFSCAALTSGQAWCWGSNSDGKLGDGTTTDRLVPVRVGTLTGVVNITTADVHGCAATAAGVAYCWGKNHYGQFGDGTMTNSLWPQRVF